MSKVVKLNKQPANSEADMLRGLSGILLHITDVITIGNAIPASSLLLLRYLIERTYARGLPYAYVSYANMVHGTVTAGVNSIAIPGICSSESVARSSVDILKSLGLITVEPGVYANRKGISIPSKFSVNRTEIMMFSKSCIDKLGERKIPQEWTANMVEIADGCSEEELYEESMQAQNAKDELDYYKWKTEHRRSQIKEVK
jgi:hypothetical protein